MTHSLLKLLVQRAKLAQGSLALVDKQLAEILSELDNYAKIFYDEPIRGEKEKSDSPRVALEADFFISPPLEVYDDK